MVFPQRSRLKLLCPLVLFLIFGSPLTSGAATTVSGTVSVSADDAGFSPSFSNLSVRVQGTEITATVDGNGTFSLTDVPEGDITILLEEVGGDWFTQSSKRLNLQVGPEPVSGVSFTPLYHWREINYPAVWGQNGYGEWSAQFINENVGFILFRVRGADIPVERKELYRTIDGGQSWLEIGHWEFNQDLWNAGQWLPSSERIFYFTDSNTGFVLAVNGCAPCGECGIGFFYTSDGGATWSTSAVLPAPGTSYNCHVDRIAKINNSHVIAAGTTGCAVQGYGSGFYDVIWESTDAGATWESKVFWEQSYGACTALDANPLGNAIAFFTPYNGWERRVVLRNGLSGAWGAVTSSPYVVNSGYGPADVPMVQDSAWIYATSQTPAPAQKGVYKSTDAGTSWSYVSNSEPQYMDFTTNEKGFGLFGGAAFITYDGAKSWLHQSTGTGLCCHGNDIWAFDPTHAAWKSNDKIFLYSDPQVADFELLEGLKLPDWYVEYGETGVAAASFRLLNRGTENITLDGFTVHASGSGDDQAHISQVKLWLDGNQNGYTDNGDSLLAVSGFQADNGVAAFSFASFVIKPFLPVYLLITLDFEDNVLPGETYRCSAFGDEIIAHYGPASAEVTATAPPSHPINGREITCGMILFRDPFENGLGNWQADTMDSPWKLTTERSISPPSCVSTYSRSRDDNNYGAKNNLTLVHPLDLSRSGNYSLSFEEDFYFDPMVDGHVQISTDHGVSWQNLLSHTGQADSGGNFEQRVIDLSSYAGSSQVLIRFQADWSSAWYYGYSWYVDNIRLVLVKEVVRGDLNDDESLGLADALLALQLATGLCSGKPAVKYWDVDGDRGIGCTDAIYILKMVAGLP